jgi:hypothetical protein
MADPAANRTFKLLVPLFVHNNSPSGEFIAIQNDRQSGNERKNHKNAEFWGCVP